jgi:beta-lactamase regulating signal transducer with metallopeptidase domain
VDDLLSIAVSNAVAAAVLALVACLAGAVNRRPALVHGLWLLVLLKLVTPPLLRIPVAWPAASEGVPISEGPPLAMDVAPPRQPAAMPVLQPIGENEPAGVESLPVAEEPDEPPPVAYAPGSPWWPRVLPFVWALGSLAWFVLALGRLYRFRRLLRFARPAPSALQERGRRLAQALGLSRCPCIRLLPGRIAPMLWAIGGPPCLLVPADLLNVLSDEQFDTLLLHELAHLRRRDHWVRALEFVVMGLYWWHPVVWYARRELREAEEQCCDAWVVSTLPGTGRTYASALLDTLDFLSAPQAAVPPLASGLSHIVDLKRRLTMIMRANTPRSLTWPGCLAVVVLGLTCLPMLPSLHGQAPNKEEAEKARRLEQEAVKFRDESRATVEQQKALIEKKKAELKRAELELKAAEAQAEAFEKQARLRHGEVIELKRATAPSAGEKKVTYRIDITAPAEAPAKEVREIIEKIQKSLPEKMRDRIRVYIGVSNQPKAAPPMMPAPGNLIAPAIPQPGQVVPPAGAAPPVVSPHNYAPDKRIDELEKKLEKVLRELHELRKQVKESHSRSSPPPTRSLDPRKNHDLDNPYYVPTVPLRPTPANPVHR